MFRLLPFRSGPIIRRAVLFAAICLTFTHPTRGEHEADVIVYGSTPGGFCAAIAAAREGASVILLEPTDHVGGVNTGGTIFPVRRTNPKQGYPYHIPYRAIVPKTGECANLLVPVALSCTHVAISSIRVEPTWMILGQSAGIAAALASEQDVAVQDLSYPRLRERLLAQGQVLDLPAAEKDPLTLPGVLDDADAELVGPWKRSTLFKPHVGDGYVHDDNRADGQSRAIFRYQAAEAGEFELWMAYSAHETRATKIPVVIVSGSQKKRIVVDQTQPLPTGQPFRRVGTVQLEGGVETVITIRNDETDGFVIVDALRLVPADG